MQTGWQSIGGSYYFFNGSGAMVSSMWVGNYYLSADGTMATNEWVGGYYVGSRTDRWIQGYQEGGQQESHRLCIMCRAVASTTLIGAGQWGRRATIIRTRPSPRRLPTARNASARTASRWTSSIRMGAGHLCLAPISPMQNGRDASLGRFSVCGLVVFIRS